MPRLALGFFLLFSVLAPRVASAQTVLAADGAYGLPIKSGYAAPGVDFGLRLGRRITVPHLWQVWELGIDYTQFSPSASNASNDELHTYRAFVGTRLGFTGPVQPGLFAHFGVGHVTGTVLPERATMAQDIGHTAMTWDAGVYIDFEIARVFQFGIQAAYKKLLEERGPRPSQWLALGGHLAVLL
ncbi:MAG TPA: hypothetical protein VHZ95_19460 [Polyangiales bacterium]|nr:hypothetical protein [Polyangiales bacterium]